MIARMLGVGAALLLFAQAHAEPPPIAAFARRPAMSGVGISPDGAEIEYLTGLEGRAALLVAPLEGNAPVRGVLKSLPDAPQLRWCRFKTATRLLCGLEGVSDRVGLFYPYRRLVAVDSDGSKLRVLVANSAYRGSQLQDDIIDWLPANPGRVLIALAGMHAQFPSVQELDVNDGGLHFRVDARPPIRQFATDAAGEVRLGCGFYDTLITCMTRDRGAISWKPLVSFEAFQRRQQRVLEPLGFGTDPNIVYARGDFEGREALWRIDLADREQPQLEFVHPAVDMGHAILDTDRRLLGVEYDTDRPQVYGIDPEYDAEMQALAKAIPEHYLAILSRSADRQRQIIGAFSDVDAGTYYLFDVPSHALRRLGVEYPELPAASLARMRTIEYPARDGTRIPGYLTVPVGVRAEHLPLIVLPHGGPRARDSWRFDFLSQFLVSRGYAVLQMNFRGSTGYGSDWLYAAHQDWGGLTYDDITDGTRWAVASGLADRARICIVGWSFGGYAALLGATRDSGLYRCAVSIAGISSLNALVEANLLLEASDLRRRVVGTDRAKLERDSPLKHAAGVSIPLLLVHGTQDWQVYVAQSERMAAALKWEKKPYELLLLEGEGHAIAGEKARAQLLEAIERFLRQNLGPGAVTPPTSPPG
jgi:dienelactone hydrolase